MIRHDAPHLLLRLWILRCRKSHLRIFHNLPVRAIGPVSDSRSRETVSRLTRHLARQEMAPTAVIVCPFIFTLEGVSEAEIGLDKVVVSQIWEVITKFAENRNIGSKAVFESAADMPEHLAATRKVVL